MDGNASRGDGDIGPPEMPDVLEMDYIYLKQLKWVQLGSILRLFPGS